MSVVFTHTTPEIEVVSDIANGVICTVTFTVRNPDPHMLAPIGASMRLLPTKSTRTRQASFSENHRIRREDMAIPDQYKGDFSYLEGLSNKGSLQASNNIYKSLKEKSKNLPELKRALDTLNVNY